MKKNENKEQKATAKMHKKVDFKKMSEGAKKTGVAVKDFLKPYANLERPVLSNRIGGFFKKNVDVIYMAGLIVLAVLFILNLGKLFCCFSAFLGGLVSLLVVFVIFRLLCEQIGKK